MPDPQGSPGTPGDLHATLAHIEQRLDTVQRGIAHAGDATPAAHPEPVETQPSVNGARAEQLKRQVEELIELRAYLVASGRKLAEGFLAALERFEAAADENGTGAPAPAPTEQPRLFSGEVTIIAGPFASITPLARFEEILAAIPGCEDVHLRTLEDAQATILATFTQPVALLDEMHRAAPFAFDAVEVADSAMVLRVRTDHKNGDSGQVGAVVPA